MKILIILNSLNSGGAENLVLDFCKFSAKNGLDVHLLTWKDGQLKTRFQSCDIKLHILNHSGIFKNFHYVKHIRKIIIQANIDIVHTHQPIDALRAWMASQWLKIKIVNTLHGKNTDKISRLNYIIKFITNKIDENIFVSNAFRDRFIHERLIGKISKSIVLYNGIDFSKMVSSSRSLRKELNIGSSEILLGSIGNFVPEKDPLTICKSIPLVLKHHPELKFVFIGSRIGKNATIYDNCINFCLKNNLTQNVFFLGSRSDIPDILNSLDIFLLSSFVDSFGIAVIEAMSMGKACILNDIPAFREISNNGKYALLFEKGNEFDLLKKMLFLIEDDSQRESLGLQGRTWALSHFSIETHIQKQKEVYQALLDARN